MNSTVFKYIFGELNPTLNFQSGEVAKFPVIFEDNNIIPILVKENVELAKEDWDSFETSWDFTTHPLIEYIEKIYYYLMSNFLFVVMQFFLKESLYYIFQLFFH